MTSRFVITGTDTNIGKTVFSAALADALGACYWKPVQSGLEGETDSETVRRLGRIPSSRIYPEAWRLKTPASPHLAARIDHVRIIPEALSPPSTLSSLVIEGAGGLLVPLTENEVFADVFARWQIPVILCARTGLGTINHTLLSLEALAPPFYSGFRCGFHRRRTDRHATDHRETGQCELPRPFAADRLADA